jgi:toxin-antitoxin system PIN domain toxin
VSFAIDVNLLLYASDATAPEHPRAAAFLASCAQDGRVFCLAWPTVMGYLRMATHPRVFAQPLPPDEAMANIEALTGLPHCRVIGEGEGFWPVYRRVAGTLPVRGNLVPDAHLAAILLNNGVGTICTHDRDFRKFDFLTVRDPLA